MLELPNIKKHKNSSPRLILEQPEGVRGDKHKYKRWLEDFLGKSMKENKIVYIPETRQRYLLLSALEKVEFNKNLIEEWKVKSYPQSEEIIASLEEENRYILKSIDL